MSIKPVMLNTTEFTDAQRKILDELARKKQLSHTLVIALKDYFLRIEQPVVEKEYVFNEPKDIEDFLLLENKKRPLKSWEIADLKKELYAFLQNGAFYKLKDGRFARDSVGEKNAI